MSRGEKKRAILESARSLYAARGYTKTSMRELSEATGLLPGSLYAHFRSKAEIARAIAMEFFDDLLPAQRAVAESAGSGADRLERMIEVVYGRCATHHEAVRILHYDWNVLSEIDSFDDVRAATDETLDLWRDVVRDGVDDGSIDPEIDPEQMVRILGTAINGIVDQSRFVMRAQPSSSLSPDAHLVRAVLHGVKRRTDDTGEPTQ